MDIFLGRVREDYTVRLYNLSFNGNYLNKYIDKDVEVEIRLESKKRTDRQNRWYWGVAIPTIINAIMEYEGVKYTKDEVHQFVKQALIVEPSKTANILGIEVELKKDFRSTSQMSIPQFIDFKNDLQKFFAERDIYIPDPEEVLT